MTYIGMWIGFLNYRRNQDEMNREQSGRKGLLVLLKNKCYYWNGRGNHHQNIKYTSELLEGLNPKKQFNEDKY